MCLYQCHEQGITWQQLDEFQKLTPAYLNTLTTGWIKSLKKVQMAEFNDVVVRDFLLDGKPISGYEIYKLCRPYKLKPEIGELYFHAKPLLLLFRQLQKHHRRI